MKVPARCQQCGKKMDRAVHDDGSMKPCSCGGAMKRVPTRWDRRLDKQRRDIAKDALQVAG